MKKKKSQILLSGDHESFFLFLSFSCKFVLFPSPNYWEKKKNLKKSAAFSYTTSQLGGNFTGQEGKHEPKSSFQGRIFILKQILADLREHL